MKLFRSQLEMEVTRGLLAGIGRGAVAGAALSVVTGAAVLSSPAAGVIVVSVPVVANWASAGSVVGGLTGGTVAGLRYRKLQREFLQVFQPAA